MSALIARMGFFCRDVGVAFGGLRAQTVLIIAVTHLNIINLLAAGKYTSPCIVR